jgi:hypothetical protein
MYIFRACVVVDWMFWNIGMWVLDYARHCRGSDQGGYAQMMPDGTSAQSATVYLAAVLISVLRVRIKEFP